MNWREWIDRPRWRALAVLHLVTAMTFAIFMTIADTKWIALADAFAAGVNFAMAYHAVRMAQMFSTSEQMRRAFESMSNINDALIQAHVGELPLQLTQEEDDVPIAPRRLN